MERILEQLLAELAGHTGVIKGPGNNLVVVGATDPAAGSEIPAADFVVPAGKIWVPTSFSVVCAQGATQTPLPAIAWDDGTNVLGSIAGATAALSVSTTARFSWVRDWRQAATAGAGLTVNTAPLSLIVLPAGYRVSTITAGIGANTNFAPAVLRVREFSV